MFALWRRFVTWLRKLLLKFYRKDKIEWDKEINEIVDITKEAIKRKNEKENKPQAEPKVPEYDIIGPQAKKRILRRLLDRILRK